MPRARVGEVQLAYTIEGDGEPLVQVHGSVIGTVNFALVTPRLAKHFGVINYDLRGFGNSDKPPDGYSISQWADDLAELIDVLNLGRAHIHGTSMGGLIAMDCAARYPDRVSGLVLDCTLARYDRAAQMNKIAWKALVEAYGYSEPFWSLLAVQIFSRGYLDSERATEGLSLLRQSTISETPEDIFAQISQAIEQADVVPLLAQIQAPTLVMIGEQDILTPRRLGPTGAGADEMVAAIPNARLAVLENCGHINLFEQPEESVELIRTFLQDLD